MPKSDTFQVSKGDADPVTLEWQKPESLEDEAWEEKVSNPDEDINELACQSLVIKMQSGARSRFDQGPEAMQAFVSNYKFGARSGGFQAPVVSKKTQKDAGFSDEQIAALRAAGVVFES